MKNLASLIGSLKLSEVKIVRDFYEINRKEEGYDLRERLFTTLRNKPDCSEKEILAILFGRTRNCDLDVVIDQVKSDIMNLLLLQEGEQKFKSKYAQAVFNCRRYIIQGEILLGRGIYEEAILLLKKAVDIAEKYELYAEQIMINDLCRTHQVIREKGCDFGTMSWKIEKSIELLQKSSRAKHQHYEITVPGLYATLNGRELDGEGEKMLTEMKDDFEETGSSRIGFYYHISAIQHLQAHGQYEKSFEHANSLIDLVKTSPAFQSDSFLAGAYMEASTSLLQLHRFQESLEYANLALSMFRRGMINEILVLEPLFYCCLHTNQSDQAMDMLSRAFENENIHRNETLNRKWIYFRAGLEFQLGRYHDALKSIEESKVIAYDKSGWMIGACILEVMCHVELNHLEWIESRVDSLRKIKLRYASEHKRLGLILELQFLFRRHQYDYQELVQECEKYLSQLETKDGPYRWDPSSYELIRFDTWLREKASTSFRTKTIRPKQIRPGRKRKIVKGIRQQKMS
jgi:tetratricopeptide (TPR) repeat protein